MTPSFWAGRRILITGHTGFKGSWMLAVLRELGADVSGYALQPPTDPSMFEALGLEAQCRHIVGDVRDPLALLAAMRAVDPEIVIHMAAQPLVRESYEAPIDTYATNVMGTVHVLDACRQLPGLQVALIVTTDKCYANQGWPWGYRETDTLGGHDPYSNSKAAAELAVSAYRDSYFASAGCRIASARAGNVIGGGDFARDRLIPDAVRAFARGEQLVLRNPQAVRPWQHVLEPVCAYLDLCEALHGDRRHARAWNFGPGYEDSAAVGDVIDRFASAWGNSPGWRLDTDANPHEAHLLRLDSSLARTELGWRPRLTLLDAIALSAEWYRGWQQGAPLDELTRMQVRSYLNR